MSQNIWWKFLRSNWLFFDVLQNNLSLFSFLFFFFRSGREDLYPSDAQLGSAVSTKFRAVFTIPIIIYLKGRPDISSSLTHLVNLSLACKFHLSNCLFPDPYLSFAAWIAISMGAGLLLSIIGGRAYMELIHRRGRKQVKQMIGEATDNDEKKD